MQYIVDNGVVKAREYNPQVGLHILTVQPVSKEQVRKRVKQLCHKSYCKIYKINFIYIEKEIPCSPNISGRTSYQTLTRSQCFCLLVCLFVCRQGNAQGGQAEKHLVTAIGFTLKNILKVGEERLA